MDCQTETQPTQRTVYKSRSNPYSHAGMRDIGLVIERILAVHLLIERILRQRIRMDAEPQTEIEFVGIVHRPIESKLIHLTAFVETEGIGVMRAMIRNSYIPLDIGFLQKRRKRRT